MEFLLQRHLLGIKNFDLLVKSPTEFEKRRSTFVGKTSEKKIVVPSSDYWELTRLYRRPYRNFPPGKFKRAYEKVLNPSNEEGFRFPRDFPWKKVMPPGVYKKEIESLIFNLWEDYSSLDLRYYFNTFKRHNVVFKSLARTAIDMKKYEVFVADGNESSSKTMLQTFAPAAQHKGVYYATRIKYDRFSAVTGRLTIKEGPGILNLRKDYRQVLTSKWGDDGGVYYIDFKSLEPRILLSLKENSLKAPQDLYMFVAEQMGLDENVDRQLIKTVIISMIYGAGDDELVRQLRGKIGYPEDFVNSIKEHFGVEDLRNKLYEEYQANGGKFIYNKYGRPIFGEAVQPYVLVNYFIQSTAVDVALSGFSNIIERLIKAGGLSYVRPLFVLHDALIVDVHNKAKHLLPKMAKAGSINIPGFENTRFWLDIERLS